MRQIIFYAKNIVCFRPLDHLWIVRAAFSDCWGGIRMSDRMEGFVRALREITSELDPLRRGALVQRLAEDPALLELVSATDLRLQIEVRRCRPEASRRE